MQCCPANLYQRVTVNNNNNDINDDNNNNGNNDNNDNDDNDNNVTRQENYIGCRYQPLQCNASEQENWDAIVKWRHWHHLQIGCIGSKFGHQVAPLVLVPKLAIGCPIGQSVCIELVSSSARVSSDKSQNVSQ